MDAQKKMKARLAAASVTAVAAAALCAGLGTGCATAVDPERRAAIRAEVADMMRFAYEAGGRAAYSNHVERMVADGKLTPERAVLLHAISQEVFNRLVEKLGEAGGTPSRDTEAVLPVGDPKPDGGRGDGDGKAK